MKSSALRLPGFPTASRCKSLLCGARSGLTGLGPRVCYLQFHWPAGSDHTNHLMCCLNFPFSLCHRTAGIQQGRRSSSASPLPTTGAPRVSSWVMAMVGPSTTCSRGLPARLYSKKTRSCAQALRNPQASPQRRGPRRASPLGLLWWWVLHVSLSPSSGSEMCRRGRACPETPERRAELTLAGDGGRLS